MNKLEQAAQALLAHWDTPIWKDVKPTADLMADLREALEQHKPNEECECNACLNYFTDKAHEEALDHSGEANEMVGCDYCNNHLFSGIKCNNCGRVVAQPVSQEYQDHLVNQSFDWSAMAAKHQFMEGYRIGLAEMREKCATVVTEHAPTCSPHWVSYVAAIRAIKFEGDTGFRPVSEMIAEHKQDPKKCSAIEKAKVRKATRAEKIAMSGVYEVPVDQAEQEPMYISKYCVKSGCACHYSIAVDGDPIAVYAAPVRTKDMTHEEKAEIVTAYYPFVYKIIDAVIAADREKNNV